MDETSLKDKSWRGGGAHLRCPAYNSAFSREDWPVSRISTEFLRGFPLSFVTFQLINIPKRTETAGLVDF